ncbi:cell division ATP-binding protein FtsE [Sphingomonas daechungensis]|uniref:Cell division ATP-binding protein FtsE n=1 Tax=Sphingomonas daechungensis TaxID=1176646 RepID=A0ABX6T3M3_9SPHN|nr:cell division ATP-binding protein FtsE [Sphingomonas daechungensis]
MSAIVEFDSVGLRYGTGAEVLRDLDFRLAKGGFYFLTGPSGAGKTSLLQLLYLARRPTRGRIQLFGQDLTDAPRDFLPDFRRRIGVVFQDFRLIRHLSTFDNVALPLRIAGTSEAELEGPVREMLAWVGLADRASARPPTLSGGEQQRVAIARAVISQPELLVADEPTGNVDAEMAIRLLHLFTALNRLGTTIVVATHDISLIARTPGAQLIRIEKGTVSDPTGLLKNPPAGARESHEAVHPCWHGGRAATLARRDSSRTDALRHRHHDLCDDDRRCRRPCARQCGRDRRRCGRASLRPAASRRDFRQAGPGREGCGIGPRRDQRRTGQRRRDAANPGEVGRARRPREGSSRPGNCSSRTGSECPCSQHCGAAWPRPPRLEVHCRGSNRSTLAGVAEGASLVGSSAGPVDGRGHVSRGRTGGEGCARHAPLHDRDHARDRRDG